MLGSMASISFTSKPKSFSLKLNTSYTEKRQGEENYFTVYGLILTLLPIFSKCRKSVFSCTSLFNLQHKHNTHIANEKKKELTLIIHYILNTVGGYIINTHKYSWKKKLLLSFTHEETEIQQEEVNDSQGSSLGLRLFYEWHKIPAMQVQRQQLNVQAFFHQVSAKHLLEGQAFFYVE
jgi:hypothetical protein